MNLIFCAILSLILVNCNVGSSAIDVSKKLENSRKETKFVDLDPDCLFLILESFDLKELLSVAQIDDKIARVASDIFRKKYSQQRFNIHGNHKDRDNLNEVMNGTTIDADAVQRMIAHQSNRKSKIAYHEGEIDLFDYRSIVNTFKYFGHETKNLTIKTAVSAPTWQSELFGYLISEYCSESLVEVKILENPDNVLKHITKPLISIESLSINYDSDSNCEASITRFSELFPALRRLYLTIYTGDDPAYIDCHMPHLEHVYIERLSENSSSLRSVISKNPQIRSIDLYRADPDFLQNVSILLPQLETFKLWHFHLQSGSIRFENVTAFETHDASSTSPENVHFPKLQTLRVQDISVRFDEYLAFLNEHTHLTHLYLEDDNLNDSQFQQLTANLTDLVELTLDGDPKLSSNVVLEFMRSHEQLTQLNIKFYYPRLRSWIFDLQAQLKYGWNVQIIDIAAYWKCLSLERICDE